MPSKAPKSKKPTTRKKKNAKTLDTVYPEWRFFRKQPVAMAFLERLADDLAEWALSSPKRAIESFYSEKKINECSFFNWRKKCDKLEDAYQFAKQVLAARREEDALENKINTSVFLRFQPLYSKKVWDLEVRRNELRKDVDKGEKSVVFKIVEAPVEPVDDKE